MTWHFVRYDGNLRVFLGFTFTKKGSKLTGKYLGKNSIFKNSAEKTQRKNFVPIIQFNFLIDFTFSFMVVQI